MGIPTIPLLVLRHKNLKPNVGKMNGFQQLSQQMHIFQKFRFQSNLANKYKRGFAFILQNSSVSLF